MADPHEAPPGPRGAAGTTPISKPQEERTVSMRLANPFASSKSLAFLLLAASLAGATPAFAQGDLVVRKPVDRRFPQGQFCPLPIDLEFTSPGSSVRVVFEAKVFVLDPNDNQLHWTEQFIDNVMMTTAATSDANTAPPPSGSDHELCYIGDPQPTPFLYFNNPGMTFQLHERLCSRRPRT
jgi:hypothetical protein